jgi:large subunit ribosomal protein L22
MEATAQSKQRYILMSHRKIRRVINTVRGKSVPEAYNILRFMPYRAAMVVLKNLKAAVSNAEQKYGESVTPDRLFISSIMADEGPAYKRFKPRAQGRVYKIESPTAHLTVEVAVKKEEHK